MEEMGLGVSLSTFCRLRARKELEVCSVSLPVSSTLDKVGAEHRASRKG